MYVCHSFCCLYLKSGLYPLPKRVLHRERSSASYFNLLLPLFSLRSSSSFLRLLSRLPVTSILPSVFPSIAWFMRQFPPKMWPILLAFVLLSVGCSSPSRLDVTLPHFSHGRSKYHLHPSTASHFKPSQVFLIYFLKCPSFTTVQSYTRNVAIYSYFA